MKTTLGQYLKEQREKKGMSIDEVAIETNISRKYIEALEKDEYGFFPAEMYVTGFLTAYIEVLELDKEHVLAMYRRLINKEQEAPLEAFYDYQTSVNKTSAKKYIRIFVLALLTFGVLAGAYYIFNSIPRSAPVPEAVQTSAIKQLTLSDIAENTELVIGNSDTLVIMNDENEKLYTVEFLGKQQNGNILDFRINQNLYSYKNGDILNTDIDGDGINDLRLEIVNVGSAQSVIELEYTKAEPASFFDIAPYRNAIRNTTPIATVTNAHSFNMTITASRPVWVGYQADSVAEQEQLLDSGQTLRISFIDGVKLSLGNAGAVTVTFGEFTNVVRGGIAGESSQSLFYKRTENNISTLFRSQLK